MSEIVSTSQNQEFSDSTFIAQTFALVPSQERISAFDGSTDSNISNINTSITPSMLRILGAEESIAF